MAFDIKLSQVSPTAKSGQTLRNYNVSSGSGQVLRAADDLLDEAKETTVLLHDLQARNQFEESIRQSQEAFSQLQYDIETHPDSSLYQDAFNQYLETATGYRPKNKKAAQWYDSWIAKQRIDGQEMITNESLARERDTARANDELALVQGDYKRAREGYEQGAANGTYSKEQAANLIGRSMEIEKTHAKKEAVEKFSNDLEMKSEELGMEGAIKWAYASGRAKEYSLALTDIQSQVNTYRSRIADEELDTKARLETAREVDRTKLAIAAQPMALSPKQMFDLIQSTSLEQKEKDAYYDSYKADLKRIADGDEADLDAEYEMSKLVGQYANTQTQADKLSAQAFWRDNKSKFNQGNRDTWRKSLFEDADDAPEKIPSFQRGIAAIHSIADAQISEIKKMDGWQPQQIKDVEIEALRDISSLRKFIEYKGPNVSEDDVIHKVENLMRAKEEKINLTSWEQLRLPANMAARAAAEAEVLADKYIVRLKEIGIWDKLDDADRAAARKLLVSGMDINDVIELTGK